MTCLRFVAGFFVGVFVLTYPSEPFAQEGEASDQVVDCLSDIEKTACFGIAVCERCSSVQLSATHSSAADAKLGELEERLNRHTQDLRFQSNLVLAIAGLLLAVAAILAGGGLAYTFLTQGDLKRRGEELLKNTERDLRDKSESVLEDLVASQKSSFDSFLVSESEERGKEFARFVDAMSRKERVLLMIESGDISNDQIYADLKHLEQLAPADARVVAERILENQSLFDEDILSAARSVLPKA